MLKIGSALKQRIDVSSWNRVEPAWLQRPSLTQRIELFLWFRIHRLPQFFVRRWQLWELKRMVREAYRNVPLYRKLLDARGVRPERIKTLDDIRLLPIMSKQLFRQYPEKEIINNRWLASSYLWKQTSGSTGEPFRFPTNARQHFLNRFGSLRPLTFSAHRLLVWQGVPTADIAARLKVAHIRLHKNVRDEDLCISVGELLRNPAEAAERLKIFSPVIVDGLTSALSALARFAKGWSEEGRPKFPYAVAHGETLLAAERRLIEDVFGCEVFDRYGLEEVEEVAVECEEHNGLHVYNESFIVEILDENDNSLPEGVPGRVVLTHFNNDAMPFIRYDTGDQGMLLAEPCRCVVAAPRLRITGRPGLILELGTKKIYHLEICDIMSYFEASILRYQFAKVGDNQAELRVIPGEGFSPDDIVRIRERFQAELQLEPEIKIVAALSREASGKVLPVVDETH